MKNVGLLGLGFMMIASMAGATEVPVLRARLEVLPTTQVTPTGTYDLSLNVKAGSPGFTSMTLTKTTDTAQSERYELAGPSRDGCGTEEYVGLPESPDAEISEIMLTDHSHRICESVGGPLPYLWVATLVTQNGDDLRMAGNPKDVTPK